MIRRSTLAIVLMAVLGSTGIAGAAGIATYQLVNTAADGSPAVTEVIATITPAAGYVSPMICTPQDFGEKP